MTNRPLMKEDLSWGQMLRIYLQLPSSIHGVALAFPCTLIVILSLCGLVDNADIFNTAFFTLMAAFGWLLTWSALERLPVIFRILKNGAVIEGELIQKEKTDTRINKQWMFKLIFSYSYGGEKYVLTENLLSPIASVKKHLIIVDKENPQNGVYLESLPTEIKIEAIRRYQPTDEQ